MKKKGDAGFIGCGRDFEKYIAFLEVILGADCQLETKGEITMIVKSTQPQQSNFTGFPLC